MKKFKTFLISISLMLFIPLIITHADWTTGMTAAAGFSLPSATVYDILTSLLEWLLKIFTVLAVIAFAVAGIMFLTAGSNADMAQKAKSSVGYSIIGITIGISGYIIVKLVSEALAGFIL